MQNSFCPTQVPAGTVQDMAKRLSKHPLMKDVPLSKCQEIMARTFGHASFHALKTQSPTSLAPAALLDPATRALFYDMLHQARDANVDIMSSLGAIEQLASRGCHWPLRDLAKGFQEKMRSGLTFSKAFSEISQGKLPIDAFLINTAEMTLGVSSAILKQLRNQALSEKEQTLKSAAHTTQGEKA